MRGVAFRVVLLSMAAGLLAGCQTAPPPQPGNEFLLAHNGLQIRKQVETLRDRRFRHVVRQRFDFSCGAAALATLLRFYYDDPVEEAAIIVEMLEQGDADRIRREGFSLLDMKHFAEARGYQTRGFRIGARVLERLAIPAITLISTRGYNHFVVIKGSENGTVYLADPALGQRRMRQTEFVDEWQNVVFFVAAHREDAAPAPLALLEANPAPEDMVRELDYPGLRNVPFDPTEF